MKKCLHLFTMLSIAALLFSACGSSRSTTEGMVMRVGNGAEPKDIDPHITTGIPEHQIELTLFEGLVTLDPETLDPTPGAATAWAVSADKLTYTFKLQHKGHWSNGDPVTARDFVYSWKRILSPALGAEYAYMLHCIKNARPYNEGDLEDFSQVGVKAEDDLTLVVTLEQPTAYFLSMQVHNSFFPVHQATIEAHGRMDERGTKWTRHENHVGNGAFRLVEWRPDDIIRVERNEHYWNAENVRLDGIEFYPIPHAQTEEFMFRSGDLHLTGTIPLQKIAVYREEWPDVLNLEPWLGVYFYRFNTSRPPFDDQRVRKAFSMAVDREDLASNVLKGGELPAYYFVPPNIPGYTSEPGVTFDPGAARKLLADAGFPNGEGFPEAEILYNTSEQHKTIAEAIQSMWKEHLNVEIKLLNQDWKVYQDSEKNLNYWISRAGWIGDYIDPINFLDMFVTDGGNNRTGFSSPAYDRLVDFANAQTDERTRTALMNQIERTLLDAAPIMPLYFYTTKYLKAAEVKNMPPNIMRYRRWDLIYLDGGEDTAAE